MEVQQELLTTELSLQHCFIIRFLNPLTLPEEVCFGIIIKDWQEQENTEKLKRLPKRILSVSAQ